MSPRKAIKGTGTGFAAVAASSTAFGAQKQQKAITPEKRQDPRTKYPKPPLKGQEQRWPGLASKINPRPDHGEKSNQGSGRAAAIAFAREGADVAIIISPPKSRTRKK